MRRRRPGLQVSGGTDHPGGDAVGRDGRHRVDAGTVDWGASSIRLASGQTQLRFPVDDGGWRFLNDGSLQIGVRGPPSQAAILQGSVNLVDWVNIATNRPFTGQFQFSQPIGDQDGRFFRTIFVE